ncbi:hypothetical protein [Methylobacterium thuringiense]|uniref:Uncharacterized protein n=1 Tax=Methylobacterium thuringiense TaxID=1003091 RepID=A0ABQ4THD0_9HYPH|nr:hypothetical protein [Methylobacterium thuringiense]GJE53912.1 hypothetical protein EKPJFOCH_0380 [Methylobacterium thuringiense]
MASSDIIDIAKSLTPVMIGDDIGKILILIGIGLIVLGGFAAFKAINSPPVETTVLKKVLLFSSCAFGFLFLISGSSLSLFQNYFEQKYVKKVVPADIAFDRMKKNARVRWLIRLIPHRETDTSLSIKNLTHLGKPEQKFAFVADYDELRGRTAEEAVRMSGLTFRARDNVSAVIFPIDGRDIIPVNARGLLQAIYAVEKDRPDLGNFNIKDRLNESDFNALGLDREAQDPDTWSWDAYGKYYGSYCAVVQRFRCSDRTKRLSYVGEISEDWHPLGFARKRPFDVGYSCERTSEICGISDWEKAHEKLIGSFGARVFLIENLEIDKTRSRILIDFDNPETQKIPYLYLDENESTSDRKQATGN